MSIHVRAKCAHSEKSVKLGRHVHWTLLFDKINETYIFVLGLLVFACIVNILDAIKNNTKWGNREHKLLVL